MRVGPFGLLCVAMHNGFEELDLNRLRRRRSEKWQLYPPDVLPAFIAPSVVVPVVDGRLQLGTWQSICLVDTNIDNSVRQVRLSLLSSG